MAMHLHRSDRTDTLAGALAELLRAAPGDPFTPEVVAVPTRGVERFLAQQLAGHLGTSGVGDGVCANVLFPQPAQLVEQVLAQCVGINPSDDPWRPRRLLWAVMDTITATEAAGWAPPLRAYLSGGAGRRYQLAEHVGRLFTSYGLERPAMLRGWLAGVAEDGMGRPVAPELAWSPPLFRALRERIGAPSPAERLVAATGLLEAQPELVDLPERVSVFGATRLPAAHFVVLSALARSREVHLWMADPSPVLWDELRVGVGTSASGRDCIAQAPPVAAAGGGSPVPRESDGWGARAAHPLLRSLGRDSRELAVRLHGGAAGPVASDRHHPSAAPPADLLGWLRADILRNRAPSPAGRRLRPDDRSVTLHSCHGQVRQAEVLREAILGLLAADESLQPRDIIVMCPDLPTFAPLVSAAFAGHPSSRLGELRVRIADRTPEQNNEVLAALQALLDLLPGRIGAAALLDFAELHPVRRKLRLSEDDLVRARELVAQAGVRWGLDQEHRAQFQLGKVAQGSWSSGLARLQLGVAICEEGTPTFGGTLPLDEVASTDIDIVGALGELVATLRKARGLVSMRAPVAEWMGELGGLVESLCEPDPHANWQLVNALGALGGFLSDSAEAQASALELGDIRVLLAQLLAGRPTRSNFRSGGLTVCGLEPMRSVPHRVVALVGLDEGSYPRASARDGDNVLLRGPALGERDPRSEDRQIMLDAILAAEQHLLITYCGRDDRTNEPQPPCVPVAELLDALEASTETPPQQVRAAVLRQHPLQPFDFRNFVPGGVGPGELVPFSHDEVARAGAEASLAPRQPPPSVYVGELPYQPTSTVSLTDLSRMLGNPVAEFLKRRLGLGLREQDEPLSEDLPIELVGIPAWAVGERLLTEVLHGAELERLAAVEALRGTIPPGQLGQAVLSGIRADVAALAGQAMAERGGERPEQVAINLPVCPDSAPGESRRLVGNVTDLYGGKFVRATYSRSPVNRQLALWVELLAVSASRAGSEASSTGGRQPEEATRGVILGKGSRVHLRAPDAAASRRLLADLLAVHDLGMRMPLPLVAGATREYALMRTRGRSIDVALRAAQRQLSPWELQRPAWVRVYGPAADFALLNAAMTPAGAGFDRSEPSLFGALAVRVWGPLLQAEEPE
ncbi:MAG: exodeoxyribonuclease V subunit gamma [Candidatus Nanopelagicales bacterium]